MLPDTAASKVTAAHLSRRAVLYVRQSSLKQVTRNTESAIRQYDLRGKAIALGRAADQVTVTGIDQGQSGSSAAGREGFQQMAAEVSLGRAGIVLGLECSRLARNNADWHQLLGAPRGAAYSCGDGRAPPPGRRSGLVKLGAAIRVQFWHRRRSGFPFLLTFGQRLVRAASIRLVACAERESSDRLAQPVGSAVYSSAGQLSRSRPCVLLPSVRWRPAEARIERLG